MNRTRLLAAAAIVGVAGIAVWLLTRPDAPDVVATTPAVMTPSVSKPADSDFRSAAPPAPPAEKKPIESTPFVDETESRPGTLDLVVVDRKSRTPVPDARVEYETSDDPGEIALDPADEGFRPYALPEPNDLLPSGVRVVVQTDAAGRARVPAFRGSAKAFAVKGSRCGTASFDAKRSGGELRVEISAGVAVRVLDSAGRPAPHATVAVLKVDGETETVEARFVTDARGETTVPSGGGAGEGVAAMFSGRRASKRRLVATALGGCGPSVPAPSVADVESRVELRLPPTGSLTVRLKDPTGAPFLEPAEVSVVADGSSAAFDMLHVGLWRVAARADDGVARFPYVAGGASSEITVSPRRASLRRGFARFDGMRRAFEETVVDVVCGGSRLVVKGKIVGIPTRFVCVYAQPVYVAENAPDLRKHVSDYYPNLREDGTFSIAFDRDPERCDARTTHVVVERSFMAPRSESSSSVGRRIGEIVVAHGPPDQHGVIDLGDVALPVAPVLARGVVVDDSGRPIPKAAVAIYLPPPKASLEEKDGPDLDAALFFRDYDDHAGATTAADGSFEINGANDVDHVRYVGAAAHGYVLRQVAPLNDEGRPLKITMTRTGSLTGSIRLPKELSAPRVPGSGPIGIVVRGSAVVRETGVVYDDDSRLAVVLLDGERFEIDSLRPGEATVCFRLNGADTDLHVVDDVVIKAGETTKDPRLQNVELFARGRMRTVRVVDDSQRPVPGATLHLRESGSIVWVSFSADRDGVVRVSTFTEAPVAVVTASGFVGLELGKLVEDATATLRAATPCRVTLKLPEAAAPPAAPYSLYPKVRWLGAVDETLKIDDADFHPFNQIPIWKNFGADRAVVFTTYQSGAFRVDLELAKLSPSFILETVATVSTTSFVVAAGAEHAACTLECDPAVLAEIIARDSK